VTTDPLVSILINNFNYATFLPEAIESALNQTYPHVEVVVVDDGSTDDSHSIIQSYGDRIIAVLQSNGGQASAFNSGFAACQGDIICFLDADDLFNSDKVAQIVDIFNTNPQAAWCFHPLQWVNVEQQSVIPNTYQGESGVYNLTPHVQRGKLAGILPFEGTATSGICYRRSLLEKLLPMPESIRITSDDYLKYVAFGLSPGFITLKELSVQRIHGNNAYTFRPEKLLLRAQIQLLTAYWIRLNHPSLYKFANNLLAAGMSRYWRANKTSQECQEITQKYFASTSQLEALQIKIRAFYYWIKK
jgi:glycosyltransferase involved in cell wall biosynthesis